MILQPGETSAGTQSDSEGPTLYRMVKKIFRKRLVSETCEFAVQGQLSDDPEFAPESVIAEWADEKRDEYIEELDGNKIGGTPFLIQADEFPDDKPWKLLMQLDSAAVPFSINFGDAGVGYAFLSEEGSTAKFLWQCC